MLGVDLGVGCRVGRRGHAAGAAHERGVELVDVAGGVVERAGDVRAAAGVSRTPAAGSLPRPGARGAALHVCGHGPRQRSRASESPDGWCACDTSGSTCAA